MQYEDPSISERNHYELLEKIFVFVTTSIVSEGEQSFVEKFQRGGHEAESKSKIEIYHKFLKYMNWKDPDTSTDTLSE